MKIPEKVEDAVEEEYAREVNEEDLVAKRDRD